MSRFSMRGIVSARQLYCPLIACSCLLLLTGCTRAHAKTTPDVPDVVALEVPAAPPHTIDQPEVEVPPPPAPAPAPEPARAAPPRPRPPAAPPREPPKPAEPAKPEPPPDAPKAPEEPARAGSTLQTTPAIAEGELERNVRSVLARANTELGRIDYRVLNADAKVQYDTAKRFIRQADDAVKAKNLVFAKSLADKAVAIADQLGGR
jgi:hypothetical protein